MLRYAIVRNDSAIPAYLPANYEVVATAGDFAVIAGEDNAGWTLDGYVIPRLGSGLHFAREVGSIAEAVARVKEHGRYAASPD